MQQSIYATASGNPYRYCVWAQRGGSTTVDADMLLFQVPTGGRVCHVYHIMVDTARPNNTGLGVPIQIRRGTSSGGSPVAANRIPRLDYDYQLPSMQVLLTGVSSGASVDPQKIQMMGGGQTTNAATSSQMNFWKAWDRRDMIVLREGQCLLFSQVGAADIDDFFLISVFWEEEA